MKLRMEKKEFSFLSPYTKMDSRSPEKNKFQNQNVLNYQIWRGSKSHKSMAKTFSKPKLNKNCNSFRTLLGAVYNSKKNFRSTDRKTDRQYNSQACHKQLLIRSIDCQETPQQHVCEIVLKFGENKSKKYYHRATTVENLRNFLKNKYPKVKLWRNYPKNIVLDYFLSMKQKDIGFLNGQNLILQPYNLQEQETVNLNSFDILHCIGTGGFSKVYLCRFKQDGKFYAMKVIDKNFIVKNKKKKIVINQKKIMEKLKHPFIIQMKFAFESKSSLVFVLQLCPGGQLFGLVKKFKIMNQQIAKFYIIQILLGLQQIHKNGIVYRDFKPENILIDMEGHIRIADFGLAKPGISTIKQKAYSFCGSPQYMPPQMILKKGHSLPVDFYCLGALLYQLVTGLPPFYSQNPNQIYQGTISEQITFPSHAKISEQLKDLLKCLLCKQQLKRIGYHNGVKQIFSHPWFRKVNKQLYMNKKSEPPVKFTGIKDLKLIFSQMEVKTAKYIEDLLNQQQNQKKCNYQTVMEKFYFDYRSNINTERQSHKSQKQNSFSGFSLTNYRPSSKTAKSKQKSIKNLLSQRSLTGNCSIRKKPLSTRYLDLNLFVK